MLKKDIALLKLKQMSIISFPYSCYQGSQSHIFGRAYCIAMLGHQNRLSSCFLPPLSCFILIKMIVIMMMIMIVNSMETLFLFLNVQL